MCVAIKQFFLASSWMLISAYYAFFDARSIINSDVNCSDVIVHTYTYFKKNYTSRDNCKDSKNVFQLLELMVKLPFICLALLGTLYGLVMA